MLWNLIARIVAHPRIALYLVRRAARTPYFDLPGYMGRGWLVPYAVAVERTVSENVPGLPVTVTDGTGPVSPWRRPIAWLLQQFDIAIRVHHILRADDARDPHDHPWDARTIILSGWYEEVRDEVATWRVTGDTATLKFGEFHHIREVSPGGVWTLFITGRKRGTWGFRSPDGRKVNWRDYR